MEKSVPGSLLFIGCEVEAEQSGMAKKRILTKNC